MTRIKKFTTRKRRKKILNFTKGFRGAASLLFRTANQRYMKALRSSYENRLKKKRNFRNLWILRLNAAARQTGLSYNEFMHLLKTCGIELNRKILSQLSLYDPLSFKLVYTQMFSDIIKKLKKSS
uniref:Large ribosomal subunit protein bL20c n=1 Tax=Koshicola spirodelophila TaxID=1707787 RepID=A0A160E6V1_9CHLO|nr:ribosomal protein L20 [Koshicola spirodelophila]